MADDFQAAIESYRAAANRTTSLPERHYLTIRAAQLAAPPTEAPTSRGARARNVPRADPSLIRPRA
ncbi:hypothetical protein OHT93_35400 [Streptomyces sp. NBC_00191]|uniref:hypothetical protein n=1 Tax=Streptomyces sp. NBC_00191 TaxID=2975674 RepID=UPI00324F6AA8